MKGLPTQPAEVIFDGGRIAALRDLELLDTASEEEFDRYTKLATELLGVPVVRTGAVGWALRNSAVGSGPAVARTR